MSVTDIVIIIGAVPLAALTVLSYYMARENGFREHGREALIIWATLGVMILVTRLLDLVGIITVLWARHILSISYLAAFIILCQVQFIINGAKEYAKKHGSNY